MRRRHLLHLAALVMGLVACGEKGGGRAPSGPLKVAAAADLAKAFPEVGALFEKKTGRKVAFSFGSTGLLAKQITEGAPHDVFAAANVSFVDDVVKAGRCAGESKSLYARGRVVVWTKAGPAVASLKDLEDARFAKIALANPEHAPYGKAAKQALEHAGVWATVEKRVVYGENVQQALQFAQTGNADAAIVALSLVLASGEGTHFVVDEAAHAPLDQALVVCGSDPGARQFVDLVASDEGRAIMKRHGFLLPGESVTAVAP